MSTGTRLPGRLGPRVQRGATIVSGCARIREETTSSPCYVYVSVPLSVLLYKTKKNARELYSINYASVLD